MNQGNHAFVSFLAATALGCCLLVAPGIAQEKKSEAGRAGSESGEGDLVRRRQEWFHRQRAYPLAHIPAGARQRALEDKETMRREQHQQASQAAATETTAATTNASGTAQPATAAAARGIPGTNAPSLTQWTAIGPMPTNSTSAQMGAVSGRVSALAVDPTNANTIFLGAAQGGVWKSINGGTSWTTTFDDAKSLAVGALAIDPNNPNTIYAGTGEENFAQDAYYGAGIYKSTDGGATWNQTAGTINNPVAGETIASFNGPFNQIVGGVHVGAIVVHPTTSTRVYAAVQVFQNVDGGAASGIFCSEDSGNTWWQVLGGAVGTDIAIDPSNSSIAYAALGSPGGDSILPSPNPTGDPTGQNGIYKTSAANLSCSQQMNQWTLVSKAPMPTGINSGRIRLDIAPLDPARPTAKIVYAAVADGTGTTGSANSAGVFQSIDGGATWTRRSPLPSGSNYCGPQCFFDMVIKVHPNDAKTVFLGGSGGGVTLQRSTDEGVTWTSITSAVSGKQIHVDMHAIAFGFTGAKVSSLVVGNDGGVWSSPLAAPGSAITDWTDLNQTLQITQFYNGLSIDPTDARIAYAGAQDNGTQKLDQTGASPLQWTEELPCGDGGYTAIDSATPTTVYAACQDIDINKSINGGPWMSIDSNIPQSEFSEFIPPLVIDPNPATSNRLYFGTFHVWQTTNSGGGWSIISPNLTSDASQFGVTSISVAPSNSAIVYAGTFDSRLWRTTQANLGAAAIPNWKQIGTLPGRAITQVAADPNNPDTVFVTMSGFSGFVISPSTTIDTLGHVFRCSAVSATCTDISGTGAGLLPNVPVNTIVVDPGFPSSNTLYIGTDVGVFGTTDGGNTWIADYPGGLNGLPDVAVFGLTLHPASRILRAVTHGRGAWDLQLAAVPLSISSISPTTAIAGSGPITLMVTGNSFTTNSVIQFNGQPVSTTFQSSTQLTGTISAALLTTPGTVQVNVVDSVSGTTPTSVPFTITADFSFSANPTSATVTRGQSAVTTLSLAPVQPGAQYPGNVTFSCSGLPAQAACVFTPATVLQAAGATKVSLSVTTVAPSMIPPAPGPGPRGTPWVVLLWALVGMASMGWFVLRQQAAQRWRYAFSLAVVLMLAGFATACGGGGGGGGGVVHNAGTPVGTFPITVTATAAGVLHTATFTVTVQ